MTALKKYQRLEAPGLWREAPEAQRRDVAISLGDATLVIEDRAGAALAHWSLPAVVRLNPGEFPAVFAPGPEAAETLELNDDLMVSAISTLQAAIDRRRPRQGRLRTTLTLGVLAAVAALAILWLPGALMGYTASVVPEAKRVEIGDQLIARIARVSGAPCETTFGTPALAKLDLRLGGDGTTLRVLPAGIHGAAHLPGGRILLSRTLVEDYEGPEVAAGHVIAERARATAQDPLEALLRDAGLGAAIRLLTTGEILESTLDAHVEALAAAPPAEIDPPAMIAMFRAAGVSSTPYAYALDVSGETTVALIEADPVEPANRAPLLADDDWVALQAICGG